MHEHTAKTRITLERMTVTTIRRRGDPVLFCGSCGREMDGQQMPATEVIDLEAMPNNAEPGELQRNTDTQK